MEPKVDQGVLKLWGGTPQRIEGGVSDAEVDPKIASGYGFGTSTAAQRL